MAISKSKKRYMVSLTPSVVERFQGLAKEIGLPPSVMSAACEDALAGMSGVLQMAKDKGSLDVTDIHRLLHNQQMELIESERRENAKIQQKRDTNHN